MFDLVLYLGWERPWVLSLVVKNRQEGVRKWQSGEETGRKRLLHPPRTASQKWWPKSRKLLKASHFLCTLNMASCIVLPASLPTG